MTIDHDKLKTLIPLIRNLAPNLIAKELVSVQPMSAQFEPEKITFETFTVDGMYCAKPNSIRRVWMIQNKYHTKESAKMAQWCIDVLGYNADDIDIFVFKTEADRTMFLLRWGS